MITNKWRLAQKLELKWWQRYLQSKDIQGYLTKKKAYWDNLLKENEIEISSGSIILDAGCGPAGINMVLSNARVVAIDPLLHSYQENIAHFDPDWYPWVRFEQSMLEQYKSEESFDYIFCMNVINHVNDINQALSTLKKHLSPNSQLILSVDVHNSSFLKRIFQWIPGDVLHPHQYDLADYKKRFQDTGFNLEKVRLLKRNTIFCYYLFQLKHNLPLSNTPTLEHSNTQSPSPTP